MNRKFLLRFDNYKIFGVGINDLHEHKTKYIDGDGVKVSCPFYVKWHSMLRRCYSEVLHKNNPSYIGCTVCDDWVYFSKFKAWMEKQDWEGKDLDKDWRLLGNKVYSPENCIFIEEKLNSFLTNSLKGVDFHKKTGKFRARVSNPFTGRTDHIGMFISYEEAYNAYVSAKIRLALVWIDVLPERKWLINRIVSEFLKTTY